MAGEPAFPQNLGAWRQMIDEISETPYFWHTGTDETRWEPPENFHASEWKQCVDARSGDTFFHCEATGETAWERPAGDVAAIAAVDSVSAAVDERSEDTSALVMMSPDGAGGAGVANPSSADSLPAAPMTVVEASNGEVQPELDRAIPRFPTTPAPPECAAHSPGELVTPKTKRCFAMVIGNASYRDNALRNPVNDARLVHASFRDVGFDSQLIEDATRTTMLQSIGDFTERLEPDCVAGFYFAGHCVQIDGVNYLLPIGFTVPKYDAVPLTDVLDQMQQSRSLVNILIIDACRNDHPGARGFGGGLAPMRAPAGSFIAFATAPGGTAADGRGANSVFSETLARTMVEPGMRLSDLFIHVRVAVRTASRDMQIPWDESSLTVNFMFTPPPLPLPTTTSVAPRSEKIAVAVVIDGEISDFDGDGFKRRLVRFLHMPLASVRIKRSTRTPRKIKVDTDGCSLRLDIDRDEYLSCNLSGSSGSDTEDDDALEDAEDVLKTLVGKWLGSQITSGNIEIDWLQETSSFAVMLRVPAVVACMLWQLARGRVVICHELRMKAMLWNKGFVSLVRGDRLLAARLSTLVRERQSCPTRPVGDSMAMEVIDGALLLEPQDPAAVTTTADDLTGTSAASGADISDVPPKDTSAVGGTTDAASEEVKVMISPARAKGDLGVRSVFAGELGGVRMNR